MVKEDFTAIWPQPHTPLAYNHMDIPVSSWQAQHNNDK